MTLNGLFCADVLRPSLTLPTNNTTLVIKFRDLVVSDGDCKLLMQTGAQQCVQLLTIHRFQAPHRQLMRNDVVRQISSTLPQCLHILRFNGHFFQVNLG